MKQYDMIFCIDSSEGKLNETINAVALTLNKFYKVLNEPENNKQIVRIINDNGLSASYRAERFLTLQEWRQKQLQRLLDESDLH